MALLDFLTGGGGGGASTIEAAGRQEQQAALQAAETERQMLGQATGYVAPWQRAGAGAVGQLGGLLGLPGYTALDPTKTLEGTPGYQFLQDQMTKRLGAYGAATGLALSGPAAKGAMQYGGGLAQTYAWQPYMSALTDVSKQGLGAGSEMGGWTMGAARDIGQDYMAAAQANAQAQIQAANARAASQSQSTSDLFGGLGFLGSLALAPFTGGGSLLGAAGGVLGAGGGGGGGGYYSGGNSLWGRAMSGWGLTGPPAPYMAEGGPAEGGRPYIVGERGPEVIVPKEDSTVIPNHLLPYSAQTDDPVMAFAKFFSGGM